MSTARNLPLVPTALVLVDAHLSSFLFGAWSTVETLVYAANAIGWSLSQSPGLFGDLGNRDALRRVAPADVMKAKTGYRVHFPGFHAAFAERQTELEQLQEQHNVSKHRHAVAAGGQQDPKLLFPGIANLTEPAKTQAIMVALSRVRWDDIHLSSDPAATHADPTPSQRVLLVDIAREWRVSVHELSRGMQSDLTRIAAGLRV